MCRKIILSRKGFDSEYGKMASPILPDGTLLSLPIPQDDDNNFFSDLTYNNLSFSEIINQLRPNHKDKEKSCHLDPDIYLDILPKNENWVACFGQSTGALTHLDSQKVDVGDIFLFFGWYKKTVNKNGKIKFERNASNKHIIYGYLQIGKICRGEEINEYPWHPHASNHGQQNAIYVAAEYLMGTDLPGSGTFAFSDDLVLTKDGMTRSKWCLPECLRHVEMTYHNSNSHKDGYFQSAMIGQEFVMNSNEDIEKWILKIVKNDRIKV